MLILDDVVEISGGHADHNIQIDPMIGITEQNANDAISILNRNEGFLYPGDDVKPIEAGSGYRDYRLADLLSYHNLEMDYGEMRYAAEPVEFVGNHPRVRQCCFSIPYK